MITVVGIVFVIWFVGFAAVFLTGTLAFHTASEYSENEARKNRALGKRLVTNAWVWPLLLVSYATEAARYKEGGE